MEIFAISSNSAWEAVCLDMFAYSARLSLLLVAAAMVWVSPPVAADSFTAFGLRNRPIGEGGITFQGGTMTVTSPGFSGVAPVSDELLPAGTFGVSIQLGEVDAGVWAYP